MTLTDINTYGKSEGSKGSYTTNHQRTGRDLLTSDEVRLLDNNEALLFIRGERPVKDLKYDILKHPNVKYTMDGKAKPYEHGCVTHDVKDWQNIVLSDKDYELVDEEELENYFKNMKEPKVVIVEDM